MAHDLDLREIIRLNYNMLIFFGILIPELNTLKDVIIYTTRVIFWLGFFFGGIVSSELINLYQSRGDVEKMTSASFLTLTNLNTIIKFYFFFKYRDRIFHLIETVNRQEFRAKNDYQYNVLLHAIKLSKIISYLMYVSCIFTCVFWAIYPFTIPGDRLLMIPAWMPFDTKSSPTFEFAFLYEFIATVVGGLTNLSCDGFMAGLILVISAQLSILNDSLMNLRRESEKEVDNGIEETVMTDKIQALMNRKLIQCIIHHRCIIKFRNEHSTLFTYSFLGQFIVGVIINCTTLFQLTVVPFWSMKFASLIFYQFCIGMEIFSFCLFGNAVIHESNELTISAYKCDWFDCSLEFKRNLLFFMIRTQLLMRTYAGNFFTLSLESFVTIVKSSLSYCAVISQMNKKGG